MDVLGTFCVHMSPLTSGSGGLRLEISASGVAKNQIYMRREASDEAGASTAEAQRKAARLQSMSAEGNNRKA